MSRLFRALPLGLAAILFAGDMRSAWPQETKAPSDAAASPPSAAAQPQAAPAPATSGPPKKKRPYLMRAAQPAGARAYIPGKWSMVWVDVVNPTDEPIEVMAVMHFDMAKRAKFARRVWLPARSRRLAWAPIKTPAVIPEEEEMLEVSTVLVDATKANEPAFNRGTGEVFYSSLLPIERGTATGLISDTSVVDDAPQDFAHEAIEAIRLSANLTRALHLMQDDFFPPTPEGLDALDQIVLSSNRIAEDSAAIAALRRWLYDGGRLWLMLDRLSPDTVARLLGDDFPCQIVDRVGMTTVRMANIGEQSADTIDWLKEPLDYETPVDLVRVVVEGADVKFTVDGWPAAFWLPAGRGKVLVTTLAARGWMRNRGAGDPPAPNAMYDSNFVAHPPLRDLGSDLFAPQKPMPLTAADFQPALAEEIGYQIPSRGLVTAILGLFCLGLLAMGVVFGRAGRREHLGWAAPAAALAAGGVLALVGLKTRQAAPTQIASGQFVEAASAVEDVRVTGVMGLYNQSPSKFPIGAKSGGQFTPDMTGLDNVPRRIIWTEVDEWRYDDLTIPAGVRMAPLSYAGRLDNPPAASATFGPEGLSGQVSMDSLSTAGDSLVAIAPTTSPLAIELGADGRFTSKGTMAKGEFLSGLVLQDRQRRRQEIYRRLFESTESGFPSRPTLLVWRQPLDLDFSFDPQARRAGDALMSIPLRIERTAPATRVTIPAACLPFRPVLGPGGESISSAYNPRSGEWLLLKTPSKCWMRFQLPAQVVPLTLDRADLKVNIRAPSRTVEFRAVKDGQSVAFGKRTDPSGEEQLSFTITDPALLPLDKDGGLLLGLWIGAVEKNTEGANFDWQIGSLSLDLSGVTAP